MPSTIIREFIYHPAEQTLDVRFTTGRRYLYHQVPAEAAEAFRAAFAKGRFFNAKIRNIYRCTELDPEPAE